MYILTNYSIYTPIHSASVFFPNSISQIGISQIWGRNYFEIIAAQSRVLVYMEAASRRRSAQRAALTASRRWWRAAAGGAGDLVLLEAASRFSRSFRQLVPQKGGARCLKAHGIRSLPESARNPDAAGGGATWKRRPTGGRPPHDAHPPGDGCPRPRGYFRATRSFWSMRRTNAAMSARAIRS